MSQTRSLEWSTGRLEHTLRSLQVPQAADASGANSVRWGILGSGLICSDFVQALRSIEGAEVTAVAARSLASAQKFASANNIPTAFGSYDELMACADVEIIYIGTIHPAHKAQTIKAMKAGKHVLCEKPMTCSRADTAELVKVAAEQGVLLVEALWTRFFPNVQKAREIIADGGIGEVLQVQGDFGFRFPDVDDAGVKHRLTDPAMAGGGTLDIGVYPLSCLLLAFGPDPPAKVVAAGALTASGVDKNVSVSISSHSNQVASLSWSIECQTPEEWRILGSAGMIIFEGPACVTFGVMVLRAGHMEKMYR